MIKSRTQSCSDHFETRTSPRYLSEKRSKNHLSCDLDHRGQSWRLAPKSPKRGSSTGHCARGSKIGGCDFRVKLPEIGRRSFGSGNVTRKQRTKIGGCDFRVTLPEIRQRSFDMVEVCEGAPVAVSGWVLTDGHDLAPCAANM